VRSDSTATNTFGRRYLFAPLDQTTFGIETRLDVTFTPALSLQVYAQPYIASADFGAPAELRAPGVYDFLQYGRDIGETEPVDGGTRIYPQGRAGAADPFTMPHGDFTIRSLRGNAVLRWEYRPGSTFFVVWQQARQDRLEGLDTSGSQRDLRDVFDVPATNVLLVKFAYWLNF
jgi:hypothetical protein